MDTTEIVTIILAVGGLLPLLTSLVIQSNWSRKVKTAASVAVSVLAGLVAYVTQEGLNVESPSSVVTLVVGVVILSAASYQSIWKPSGITDKLTDATTPNKSRVPEKDSYM